MLPDWIYEPLPYLYLLVGLISLFQLDSMIGRVSALLLISAGALVWHMRRQSRKKD